MDIDFDAAAEVEGSTGRKPYFEPNVDFVVLITKAEFSDGYTGNKYLIEGRVLKAEATEDGAKVPAVGAERFHGIDLDNKDYGMPNLMSFVVGLNGGPLQPITKGDTVITKGQQMRVLCGEAGVSEEDAKKTGKKASAPREALAVGMFIGNRTNAGPSVDKEGKPKKPFTYMNWYTIKQTQDEIKERKALIKAGRTNDIKLGATNVEVDGK